MDKILLVDDSADILEALKIFLEMKHFAVKTLQSAYRLPKEISEFKPKLLILDVSLGGKDESEVCKSLRQNSETSDLPILLTSTSRATLVKYKTCMANDYLVKPFDLNTLHQKIKHLLQ